MERQASVLVCDDFYVSLNGKFIAHGIYTTNILIPEPLRVNQLVFLFQIETDVEDPFERLLVQATLPGQVTKAHPVPMPPFVPAPGQTRQIFQFPLLVQYPTIQPGQIEAKIIHERGEIIAATPWVVLAQFSHIPAGVPSPPPKSRN